MPTRSAATTATWLAKTCLRACRLELPGIAGDAICGSRRRCVPLPQIRVVVHDATSVEGVDAEDRALPIGNRKTPHQAVHLGRDGFVVLMIAGRPERVAVDYGSRYTIEVRGDSIARVTRD